MTAGPGPGDSFAEDGAALIRERTSIRPVVAIVLGSGLGDAVAEDVRDDQEFAYEVLPGFPPPSVPGHAGRLVVGELYGVPAAVFRGRVHYYEGHGIGPTTLIPRLAAVMGASVMVLTNAAGGLVPDMRAGSLLLIEDHLNFLGVNPLTGWTYSDGTPAFVPLANVYDPRLRALVAEVGRGRIPDLRRGVYVALPGPSFETPAETRFLRSAGADVVGMSTVPEAVAGAALGLSVLGISAITNVAGTAHTHQDVLAAARDAAGHLRTLLSEVIPRAARIGFTPPPGSVDAPAAGERT